MLNSRIRYPIFITTLALWWGLTFFTDVLVAPVIFRIIENFFNAGDLAMTLFTRWNNLEIVLSSGTLLILLSVARKKQSWIILGMGLICWSASLFYFAYLIPKITALTELWKEADKMGVLGIGDVRDVQQEHQFYHRIYVGMDVVKLCLLTVLLGLGIFKEEKFR